MCVCVFIFPKRYVQAKGDNWIVQTSKELLQSDACQQLLRSLAHHFQLDILDLERNHSTIRRTIQSKSIHTWATSYSSACAHWVVRRVALLRRFFNATPKQKKVRSTRKKLKKQVQGGGPWRAFLHMKARNAGQMWSGRFMRNMSQEYQAAKCGPDFQMFQELGVLGEMARRGGKSSFSSSRPPKASQPARVGLDAVLLQGADRLENDIKEALADIRSSSRARAASMELAMQDAAAAVAASSAALAPAQEADGVANANRLCQQLGSAFIFTSGKPSVAEFCVPADRFCQDTTP